VTHELALAADGAESGGDADAELVVRAARGDGEAFDRLVARHWAALVRLARVVQASDNDAEDLAQETLTKVWSGLRGLRDPARFVPWMRRILVRDAVRAARRRRSREPEADRRADAALAPTGGVPWARLEVAAALRALSPRQRAVFYWTEIEGASAAETAAALGIAPATVRVHRLLARRQLAAFYGRRPS
jgi:RNA polymerase sigma-70 factor (ECF subfamily)